MGRFDGWDRALESGDPLEVLRTAVVYQAYLEAAKRSATAAARANGATWDEIAGALGVTRQSAWDRFRHETSSRQLLAAADRDRRSRKLRLKCPSCGKPRVFEEDALVSVHDGRRPVAAQVEVRTACEACGDARPLVLLVPPPS